MWNVSYYVETLYYTGLVNWGNMDGYEIGKWELGTIERRYDTNDPVTYIHTRSTDNAYPWAINFNGWAGPNVGDGTYSWGFA